MKLQNYEKNIKKVRKNVIFGDFEILLFFAPLVKIMEKYVILPFQANFELEYPTSKKVV